jgi:GNAT superfamily N-acetyltransferase
MSVRVPIHGAARFDAPEEVSGPSVLEEIGVFRVEVWRATLGQPALFGDGRWLDELDRVSRHWVIRDRDGRLVGAARLSLHASLDEVPEAEEYARFALSLRGPLAAPARVVVCPSAQGAGLGRQLLDCQEQAARRAGARSAVRQASPAMARLLARRGWQIAGPACPDPRLPGVIFQVASFQYASERRLQVKAG